MRHRINKHIDRLVKLELKESKQYYEEFFNSPHEGYAIIEEEFEEAEDEMRRLRNGIEALWDDVKEDNVDIYNLMKMRETAKWCASEIIQTAAMIAKFFDSVVEWNEQD